MAKKECPSCAMEVPVRSKECPICGYEFTDFSPGYKWVAILLILVFLLFLII